MTLPARRLMVLRVAAVVGTVARVTGAAASADATPERPPSAPEISSTGSCPSADTIWTAMATLVPKGALDALPRSASVDVADLGETYRVRLTTGNNQRVRVYRDLARDCEQRARFAAVFVVLTLMPPELLIDSPPKLPPPEPLPPRCCRRPRPPWPRHRPAACAWRYRCWATPRPRCCRRP